MAIAAVPGYLGQDFTHASPGMRFGMYLSLWGVDSRTGSPLWTTHDLNFRMAGQQKETREFKDENKSAALSKALKLGASDLELMRALQARIAAQASHFVDQGRLLNLEARCISPFTTGLGNEHPLENGFAFLNPYGLPYLAGSGIKGVLRNAARELCDDWGDAKGWTADRITALFGRSGADADDDFQRGALSFWDVIPQLAGDSLQVEIMTPHSNHYLQKGEAPHDSGQPNPINFLTVPPGSGFSFHIECDEIFLAALAPELAEGQLWRPLIEAALEHAFDWLGFGAKTAVGYGAMAVDEERMRAFERLREDQEQKRREQAREVARVAEKAAMSPADRAMADLFDQRTDKNQDERAVLFAALKSGKLVEHKVAAARRLKSLMQQASLWRETSTKKNPDKDYPYQDTLMVIKWLES